MNPDAESEKFLVLAALDGHLSDRVALVAARLTVDISGGELHLVRVIDLALPAGTETTAAIANGRARLQQAGATARKVHQGRVIAHLAAGDPCHEILEVATRLKADLVVVGIHGQRGFDHLLMGSVAEQVVRRASCPVLVVREKAYHADPAIEIEPRCAECIAAELASHGSTIWCVRHSQRRPHAHTHYETPDSFALGSSIIRP
jgi:nucleotide-binding universal stress UspA family protein